MDKWKPEHLKAVFCGGNKKASDFFKSHGWESARINSFEEKYQSPVAKKYRNTLCQLIEGADLEEILRTCLSPNEKTVTKPQDDFGGKNGLEDIIREHTPPPFPTTSSGQLDMTSEKNDKDGSSQSSRNEKVLSSSVGKVNGKVSNNSCDLKTDPGLPVKNMSSLMLGGNDSRTVSPILNDVPAIQKKAAAQIVRRSGTKTRKKSGLGATRVASSSSSDRKNDFEQEIATADNSRVAAALKPTKSVPVSKYRDVSSSTYDSNTDTPVVSPPLCGFGSVGGSLRATGNGSDDVSSSKEYVSKTLDRLKNAKSISSSTFFREENETEEERRQIATQINRFANAVSISSNDFFEREDHSETAPTSLQEFSEVAVDFNLSSASQFFSNLSNKVKEEISYVSSRYS